jgi:hypothetical protein
MAVDAAFPSLSTLCLLHLLTQVICNRDCIVRLTAQVLAEMDSCMTE